MSRAAPLFFGPGALCALLLLLPACTRLRLEAPRPLGPACLVTHDGEPRLWRLVQQPERKVVAGRDPNDDTTVDTFYHFDLHCHDSRTAERLWKKPLLTLRSQDGGNNASARILGQDGDAVWLFLNDQPLAVAAADGHTLGNRESIKKRNPALAGLLPGELKFYGFDNGLILTTADARRYRVRAGDFAAEPYTPPSEEEFTRQQHNSNTWDGGYATKDFLVRQAFPGGVWLGLYTAKEAADVGNDEFGRRFAQTTPILDEGRRARRTFYRARIGKTREFPEGVHNRFEDVKPAPGAPDFLEAGMLIKQETRDLLPLAGGSGYHVLHRTRVDALGRLALTAVDDTLRPRWTAELPIQELRNRYEFPDRLLLIGTVAVTENGTTSNEEILTALRLADGKMESWNVPREKRLPTKNAAPAAQ